MRHSEAPSLLETLLEVLHALPATAVYWVIGSLAAVENVFPPVPADTAVALGAFLSYGGTVSATAVFGITWSANVGSAAAVYAAARVLGRPFFRGRLGRRLLNPKALRRLERLYDRHGTWGIFASRFVPVARAVVPAFAGIVKLSVPRALIPLALASGIWYGALTLTVASFANEVEDLARLLDGLNWVGLAVGVVLLLGIGTAVFLRKRRKMAERQGGSVAGRDDGMTG